MSPISLNDSVSMTDPSEKDQIWQDLVTELTGCKNPARLETVQSLWSGFGEVFRVTAGSERFIVKRVRPPTESVHPRGWNSDFATKRKLRSYEVETYWYHHYSHQCDARVPGYIGSWSDQFQRLLVLEDLDYAGFPQRFESPSMANVCCCLDWLAAFHAQFLHSSADGLWPVGTYWHLATRPDEFNVMADSELKRLASHIDRVLSHSKHQTLVHGDAKLANFCFGTSSKVAAVDFQYVGGGCGMKDLAYFIGSCLDEDECSTYEEALLDRYFNTFSSMLGDNTLGGEIEAEWRKLYPLAWTDFYRFLAGWMPTHKKTHRYTKLKAEQTFDLLPAPHGC